MLTSASYETGSTTAKDAQSPTKSTTTCARSVGKYSCQERAAGAKKNPTKKTTCEARWTRGPAWKRWKSKIAMKSSVWCSTWRRRTGSKTHSPRSSTLSWFSTVELQNDDFLIHMLLLWLMKGQSFTAFLIKEYLPLFFLKTHNKRTCFETKKSKASKTQQGLL